MKFFTDFWEEMNDVKMIDKKIGQPKLDLWWSKSILIQSGLPYFLQKKKFHWT